MKTGIFIGLFITGLLCALPVFLHAQGSSAELVLPGFLSSATTGSAACPNAQATCWLPYTTTNPMPSVTVSP